MATNVQRLKALADAITDRDTDAQLLSEFADDCILLRPDLYTPADPENPTNAERAEVTVQMFRQYAQHLRRAAEKNRQEETARAAVEAKADAL